MLDVSQTHEETKFIFVEDEPEIREIFKIFLNSVFGPDKDIMYFMNGKECLDYLSDNPCDTEKIQIFSDINMPVMDGFTLLREVKEKFPEIDVILCSAYDSVEYKEKGKELGASMFIAKPVDFKQIIEIIKER